MDRTRAPRDARQGGFTLVELLVVMALLGVVGGVVVNAITTGLASASTTTARTMAIHDLEVALQRVARDLRAADPIYLSSGGDYRTELGAEFLRDGGVHVTRFGVEADGDVQRLVQATTRFDVETDVTNPTATDLGAQTLVADIDNGDEPVFRYYRRNGQPIECEVGVAGETKSSCDAAYAEASRLEVSIVRAVEGQSPVRARTQVSIRNTRYGS